MQYQGAGSPLLCLRPHLIGYGLTDSPKDAYTLRDFLDFTHELVGALRIKRAHFIGHSLGGRICLDYAFHHPERVDRIIAIAPMGLVKLSLLGYLIGTIAWVYRRLASRKQPYPVLRLDAPPGNSLTLADRLGHIDKPVLIAWGKRDIYLPVYQAMKAHKLLRNSRLEIFPRCGHAPQKEASETFNKLAMDFLAEDEKSPQCSPRLT